MENSSSLFPFSIRLLLGDGRIGAGEDITTIVFEYVGFDSQLHRLSKDAPRDELLRVIASLNKSSDVHGILLQLPLPSHFDAQQILQAISPAKDVDALHPENVGRLSQGRPRFLPCTPHGVQQLLLRSDDVA